MEQSKPSIEDLLKAAEGEEENHSQLDDVEMFLLMNNIGPGPNHIEPMILYRLYKEWTKNPFSTGRFYNRLKQLLKRYRWGTKHYYMLNIEVPKEKLFRWRREERDMRVRKAVASEFKKDEKTGKYKKKSD